MTGYDIVLAAKPVVVQIICYVKLHECIFRKYATKDYYNKINFVQDEYFTPANLQFSIY